MGWLPTLVDISLRSLVAREMGGMKEAREVGGMKDAGGEEGVRIVSTQQFKMLPPHLKVESLSFMVLLQTTTI